MGIQTSILRKELMFPWDNKCWEDIFENAPLEVYMIGIAYE